MFDDGLLLVYDFCLGCCVWLMGWQVVSCLDELVVDCQLFDWLVGQWLIDWLIGCVLVNWLVGWLFVGPFHACLFVDA